MTRSRDMSGLHELARLVLDHRLSVLREVADRRDQSKAQIAALNLDPGSSDLAPAQAGQVAFRYQLWADVRRAELNSLLSRQTAEWLAARDEARVALGRTDALRALAGRQNGRK